MHQADLENFLKQLPIKGYIFLAALYAFYSKVFLSTFFLLPLPLTPCLHYNFSEKVAKIYACYFSLCGSGSLEVNLITDKLKAY